MSLWTAVAREDSVELAVNQQCQKQPPARSLGASPRCFQVQLGYLERIQKLGS